MSYSIDTNILRKKLSKAKIQKSKIKAKIQEPPEEETERLRYVIDNILNPLLNGEKLHTGDLNFDEFNRDDLEDLLNYYYDYLHDGTYEWERLKKVFDVCNTAQPMVLTVGYI